jgi:D-tyrosyl-tRNA(Tyr) deacylase
MKLVIQRVNEASVTIEGKIHSSIGKGFLVLVGIQKGDTEREVIYLANKTCELRIFSDENEKINLSLKDVDGEILAISQFTLINDSKKSGNRPSFVLAEEPQIAKKLYEKFLSVCEEDLGAGKIKNGVFAAHMKIKLENDGPVTLILEKRFEE